MCDNLHLTLKYNVECYIFVIKYLVHTNQLIEVKCQTYRLIQFIFGKEDKASLDELFCCRLKKNAIIRNEKR